MSHRAEAIAEAIAISKRQIQDDIASGRVPADVRDFGALHDHVDANEYGDLTDPHSPLADDEDAAGEVQEAVHQWLLRGRVDPTDEGFEPLTLRERRIAEMLEGMSTSALVEVYGDDLTAVFEEIRAVAG